MDERRFGKALDFLGRGQPAGIVVDAAFCIRIPDRRVLGKVRVGEAGGMAQQILHRHFAIGRNQ